MSYQQEKNVTVLSTTWCNGILGHRRQCTHYPKCVSSSHAPTIALRLPTKIYLFIKDQIVHRLTRRSEKIIAKKYEKAPRGQF